MKQPFLSLHKAILVTVISVVLLASEWACASPLSDPAVMSSESAPSVSDAAVPQGTDEAWSLMWPGRTDGARTQIWGERNSAETPLTYDLNLGSGTASAVIPMYGRVSSGQTGKPPAVYTSTFSGGGNGGLVRIGTTAANCATLPGPRDIFSFNATATISTACTITSSPLSFRTIGRIVAPINSTTTLGVSCGSGVPYSIALNGGTVTGSIAARSLGVAAAPPGVVSYQLYTDAARTQVWGNGTTGSTVIGSGTGAVQTLTVYGRVPVQSSPAQNVYTDKITATVNY